MRTAAALLVVLLSQEKVLLEEKFAGKPGAGWTWAREDAGAWKVDGGALQIKALPGKIWYKTKTAKNVQVRKLPDKGTADAPLAAIIEDVLYLSECSLPGEWEGQVRYLPLR